MGDASSVLLDSSGGGGGGEDDAGESRIDSDVAVGEGDGSNMDTRGVDVGLRFWRGGAGSSGTKSPTRGFDRALLERVSWNGDRFGGVLRKGIAEEKARVVMGLAVVEANKRPAMALAYLTVAL